MKKISTISLGIILCSFGLKAQTWISNTGNISTTGNVGIGTATPPLDRLQIKTGNIRVSENYSIRWEDNQNTIKGSLTVDKSNILLKSDFGSFEAYAKNNIAFYTLNNGTYSNKFNIANNGKIGIGTTNNSATLSIRDTNAAIILNSTGKINYYGPLFSNQMAYEPNISFVAGNKNYYLGTKYEPNSNIEYFRIFDKNDAKKIGITISSGRVYLGSNEGTTINPHGAEVILNKTQITQLAIGGKFASDSKLSVQGKATFEEAEVKLSSAWPDYVFTNDYHLASLDSVEAYIQENAHLPNVPSAQEVANNGINLGQMDAILLRKIEELTLYNIQLNKQMLEMKKQLESIQQK